MSADRPRGTVKWFNATKGFGFITPDNGGEDLFVHQTSIQAGGFRSLKEGEPVEYDIATGDDGRTKAVRVTAPEGGQLYCTTNPERATFQGHGGGNYGRQY